MVVKSTQLILPCLIWDLEGTNLVCHDSWLLYWIAPNMSWTRGDCGDVLTYLGQSFELKVTNPGPQSRPWIIHQIMKVIHPIWTLQISFKSKTYGLLTFVLFVWMNLRWRTVFNTYWLLEFWFFLTNWYFS